MKTLKSHKRPHIENLRALFWVTFFYCASGRTTQRKHWPRGTELPKNKILVFNAGKWRILFQILIQDLIPEIWKRTISKRSQLAWYEPIFSVDKKSVWDPNFPLSNAVWIVKNGHMSRKFWPYWIQMLCGRFLK